jgi:recombination protein RecA
MKKKTKKKQKADEPTSYEVLQATLKELRASVPGFRGGFGSEPEVQEMLDYPKYPCPIPAINRLSGGGIPGGKWTTIFGPEKVGKTTFCLQLIAHDQEENKDVRWAWFDVENGFDREYAAALGVDLERLLVVPAGMIMEDQMDAVIKLGKTGFLRGFVVDSMGSYVAVQELMTKKGADRGMREDTVTAVARKLSEFFRKATPQIARHKMAQILIGHLYQGIGAYEGMVQKGGHAVKHWAHLRFTLRRTSDDDLKKPVVQPDGQTKNCFVGFNSILRVDKTKQSATEGQEVEVPFLYGIGFDSVESSIRTGMALGVIERVGAWYRHHTFPGDKCQLQGKSKTKEFVRENPSVLATITNEILQITDEMYGLKKVDDPGTVTYG